MAQDCIVREFSASPEILVVVPPTPQVQWINAVGVFKGPPGLIFPPEGQHRRRLIIQAVRQQIGRPGLNTSISFPELLVIDRHQLVGDCSHTA
jgi:hypothetical protein